MVRITVDLLRRRSEHNEGELSTLEEISLHQFDIERIESLDKYCRHLKIIYLQNNVIPRMENLNRLKSLEYLNLALNNISLIEGIDKCESLKKLDLTLNFIPLANLESSCRHLAKLQTIEQLYLTGNPCTDWDMCRKLVIALVPQLKQLDSNDITHTERLEALQELPGLLEHLQVAIRDNLYQKPTNYTKEARIQMAQENEKIQKEKERESKESDDKQYGVKKTQPPPLYNDRGEIRQCNQGGYEYSFYEKNEKDKQFIILEIAVPRYLDTSQIDVDLNPTYVRIDIKGKFLQLTFPCEISVNESQAKRSQANGSLQLVMKKLNNSLVPYFFMKEELDDKNKRTGKKDVEVEKKGKKEGNEDRKEIEKMDDKGKMKRDMEKWEDDPDVPPLE